MHDSSRTRRKTQTRPTCIHHEFQRGLIDRQMSKWFVRLRNKVSGHYSADQLRAMRRVGGLSRLHEISTDRENWKPATTFAELFQEKELVLPAKRPGESESPMAVSVSGSPLVLPSGSSAPGSTAIDSGVSL